MSKRTITRNVPIFKFDKNILDVVHIKSYKITECLFPTPPPVGNNHLSWLLPTPISLMFLMGHSPVAPLRLRNINTDGTPSQVVTY